MQVDTIHIMWSIHTTLPYDRIHPYNLSLNHQSISRYIKALNQWRQWTISRQLYLYLSVDISRHLSLYLYLHIHQGVYIFISWHSLLGYSTVCERRTQDRITGLLKNLSRAGNPDLYYKKASPESWDAAPQQTHSKHNQQTTSWGGMDFQTWNIESSSSSCSYSWCCIQYSSTPSISELQTHWYHQNCRPWAALEDPWFGFWK